MTFFYFLQWLKLCHIEVIDRDREVCVSEQLNLGIMENVIGGKFKLGRKIGSGSFGELYLGVFLFYILLVDFVPFLQIIECNWRFFSVQVLTYKAERRWESSWYVLVKAEIYGIIVVSSLKLSTFFMVLLIFRNLSKPSILNFTMSLKYICYFRVEVRYDVFLLYLNFYFNNLC